MVHCIDQILAVVVSLQLFSVSPTNLIVCGKLVHNKHPFIYTCYRKYGTFPLSNLLPFCKVVLRISCEVLEHRYSKIWPEEPRTFCALGCSALLDEILYYSSNRVIISDWWLEANCILGPAVLHRDKSILSKPGMFCNSTVPSGCIAETLFISAHPLNLQTSLDNGEE